MHVNVMIDFVLLTIYEMCPYSDQYTDTDFSHLRMPVQGGYTLTRLRIPDPDGVVPACACYFCATWAVNHRRDPAFR